MDADLVIAPCDVWSESLYHSSGSSSIISTVYTYIIRSKTYFSINYIVPVEYIMALKLLWLIFWYQQVIK